MKEMGPEGLTGLLSAVRSGDKGAGSELVRMVYGELRELAGSFMRRQRVDHTLQPTALLNEALLKGLQADLLSNVRDRACLLATCARAMRQVLVDHARGKLAQKRGGGAARELLTPDLIEFDDRVLEILTLEEALVELASLQQRQADAVTLRFFGGLSVKDVALHLDVSAKTVELDLRLARAWLRKRLGD